MLFRLQNAHSWILAILIYFLWKWMFLLMHQLYQDLGVSMALINLSCTKWQIAILQVANINGLEIYPVSCGNSRFSKYMTVHFSIFFYRVDYIIMVFLFLVSYPDFFMAIQQSCFFAYNGLRFWSTTYVSNFKENESSFTIIRLEIGVLSSCFMISKWEFSFTTQNIKL